MNYYFTDSEDFTIEISVMIDGQFEHDLYNKSFSNQLESVDEVDFLLRNFKWWLVVVDRVGLIPNDVNEYTFDELYVLYRKTIAPELKNFVKAIRDS